MQDEEEDVLTMKFWWIATIKLLVTTLVSALLDGLNSHVGLVIFGWSYESQHLQKLLLHAYSHVDVAIWCMENGDGSYAVLSLLEFCLFWA